MENNRRFYLRHGDFHPEELDDTAYRLLGYPSKEKADSELIKAGNMFDCLEDAVDAALAVRAKLQELSFIRQDRQAYSRLRQMQYENISHPHRPYAPETSAPGKKALSDEPRSPIAQSVSCRRGVHSQEIHLDITLTVH